jgi:hypothetical protein
MYALMQRFLKVMYFAKDVSYPTQNVYEINPRLQDFFLHNRWSGQINQHTQHNNKNIHSGCSVSIELWALDTYARKLLF